MREKIKQRIVRTVNSFLMPEIDENYVNTKLDAIAHLHGLSIGRESITLRGYDPVKERLTPLEGSESMDNHIKYGDIALIDEKNNYVEISLWNGYMYFLSKTDSRRILIDTHRKLHEMFFWSIRRSPSVSEITRNISLEI